MLLWTEISTSQKEKIDHGNHAVSNKYLKRRKIMTKVELIRQIANRASMSQKDAEKALKAFTEAVTEALKEGDKVALVGFGTFEVSERAGRTGRNPQTGEPVEIPASKSPKFKAGKALKDAVK